MAQAGNFTGWVQGSGHEQALKAYNDWVFGENPVYKEGDKYLFIHGEINNPDTRQETATVSPNTIIVVHVVGVNFIIGDVDTRKNPIDDDEKVSAACQFSAQNEDKKVYVRIRPREGLSEEQIQTTEEQTDQEAEIAGWTILTDRVEEVSYSPDDFTAHLNNNDLKRWDAEMPVDGQRGAWASKLLLLKAPTDQVGKDFELKSHGTGIPPYQQKTHFEIKVR